MGGKSGTCQDIGHAYYMRLAYAFCGLSEEFLGFKRAGTIEWEALLTLTLASTSGLEEDTYLLGSTSGARCKVQSINGNKVITRSYVNTFSPGETVTGYESYKCEDATGFSSTISLIEQENGVTTNGGQFEAVTGLRPDPMPSNYKKELESCPITYYNGTQTAPNATLLAETGSSIIYKGTSYIVIGDRELSAEPADLGFWNQQTAATVSTDGAYIGVGVTTVPQYEAKIRRTTVAADLGESRINNDVNPVNIIYDILTTHLEIDEDFIDLSSFTAAAAVIADEEIGVSFIMTREKSAADWINEILRHIDGAMYYNIYESKYTIKLFRDDYDLETIPTVTENNSFDLEIERKSWLDTFNTVTFKYNDIDAKEARSLTLIDTAAKKTVGQVKAKTVEYMCITERSSLELIANRAMKKLSYPLAAVKFKVSLIDFPFIAVGDVLNLTHEQFGVSNMPIRVLGLGGDKEDSTIIEIEGSEDIYGVSKAFSIREAKRKAEIEDYTIEDMVYADVMNTPPELQGLYNSIPVGANPGGAVISLYAEDTTDSTHNVTFNPYLVAELNEDITVTEANTYGFFDIDITELTDTLASYSGSDAEWQYGTNLIAIGDEIFNFHSVIDNGGGSYTLTQCMRAMLGSVATAHTTGDKIWFVPPNIRSMAITGTSVPINIYGVNARMNGGALEVIHTPSMYINKPYDPSNVQTSRAGNDVTITWSPTVRSKGATYYNSTNIAAGIDEGLQEGQWLVSWDTGSQVVGSPNFAITEAATKTYTIKSQLNGYASTGIQVTI